MCEPHDFKQHHYAAIVQQLCRNFSAIVRQLCGEITNISHALPVAQPALRVWWTTAWMPKCVLDLLAVSMVKKWWSGLTSWYMLAWVCACAVCMHTGIRMQVLHMCTCLVRACLCMMHRHLFFYTSIFMFICTYIICTYLCILKLIHTSTRNLISNWPSPVWSRLPSWGSWGRRSCQTKRSSGPD